MLGFYVNPKCNPTLSYSRLVLNIYFKLFHLMLFSIVFSNSTLHYVRLFCFMVFLVIFKYSTLRYFLLFEVIPP